MAKNGRCTDKGNRCNMGHQRRITGESAEKNSQQDGSCERDSKQTGQLNCSFTSINSLPNKLVMQCNSHSKNTKLLSIGLINSQSVLWKPEQITDYLLELDLNILFLTETWLRPDSVDNGTINYLTVPGCSFKHKPPKSKTQRRRYWHTLQIIHWTKTQIPPKGKYLLLSSWSAPSHCMVPIFTWPSSIGCHPLSRIKSPRTCSLRNFLISWRIYPSSGANCWFWVTLIPME